jgi:hypothetical protein
MPPPRLADLLARLTASGKFAAAPYFFVPA